MAKLDSEVVVALSYEEPANQAAALRHIPKADLERAAREKYAALRQKEPATTKPAVERDLLLLELLRWFKEDFFSWVNSPKCDRDGGETTSIGMLDPTEEEKKDGAGRVEGYIRLQNSTICFV